jgi:hypothetical protein
MITPQLLDFARQRLATGTDRNEVEQALRINGLNDEEVAQVFTTIGEATPVVGAPPPVEPPPIPQVAVREEHGPRPRSVRYFELLMYASVLVGIAIPLTKYREFITPEFLDSGFLFLLLLPASLILLRLVLIFLAAHRKANWARFVLLVLFLGSFLGIFGLVGSSDPVFIALNVGRIILEFTAFCFVFSSSANKWFEPEAAGNGPLAAGTQNATWSKTIPRTNKAFMGISLLLVFGLDLFILISSPELFMFWAAMVAVLVVFGIFFYCENYVLAKRYLTSQSNLDRWISFLVIVRNVVFILSFIPLVQILGGMLLVTGGIPYLIIYLILVVKRTRLAQAS